MITGVSNIILASGDRMNERKLATAIAETGSDIAGNAGLDQDELALAVWRVALLARQPPALGRFCRLVSCP